MLRKHLALMEVCRIGKADLSALSAHPNLKVIPIYSGNLLQGFYQSKILLLFPSSSQGWEWQKFWLTAQNEGCLMTYNLKLTTYDLELCPDELGWLPDEIT